MTVEPTGEPRRNFVLDSIVVVRAPSGRFMNVPTAPSVSANAMSAPPCRMSPVVHKSGRTLKLATTFSAVTSENSIPSSPGNNGLNSVCSDSEVIIRPPLQEIRKHGTQVGAAPRSGLQLHQNNLKIIERFVGMCHGRTQQSIARLQFRVPRRSVLHGEPDLATLDDINNR